MTSTEHLRRPLLLALHLGEAADAGAEAHLTACDACRASLDGLAAERTAYFDRVDVGAESAAILARLERPATGRAWPRAWAFALVPVVAALAFLVVRAPEGTREKGGRMSIEPRERSHGAVTLEMFVKDARGVRPARDGERLVEGDQIQFRYDAAGRPFLFLLSVDSRGVITPLFPNGRGASVEIAPSGLHTLDGSVILDDAKGPERFFALFSTRPLAYEALEPVVRARLAEVPDLTRLRTLDVGADDGAEASILVVKE